MLQIFFITWCSFGYVYTRNTKKQAFQIVNSRAYSNCDNKFFEEKIRFNIQCYSFCNIFSCSHAWSRYYIIYVCSAILLRLVHLKFIEIQILYLKLLLIFLGEIKSLLFSRIACNRKILVACKDEIKEAWWLIQYEFIIFSAEVVK